MIVKCPKCRFKYEAPVTPGAKEISCVCSRCGYPFSFVVPEDVQNEVHQESTSRSYQPSSEMPTYRRERRYDERPRERSRVQNTENYDEYEDMDERDMQSPPSYYAPTSRRQGCVRRLFIFFIVALIFAVFALRHCYYEKSYTAESITAQEMPKMTEEDNLSEITPKETDGEEDELLKYELRNRHSGYKAVGPLIQAKGLSTSSSKASILLRLSRVRRNLERSIIQKVKSFAISVMVRSLLGSLTYNINASMQVAV